MYAGFLLDLHLYQNILCLVLFTPEKNIDFTLLKKKDRKKIAQRSNGPSLS